MGLKGLLFARTWRPPVLFTNSTEEIQAIHEQRTRQYEKFYNWARYLVAAITLVVLFCMIGFIIEYYISSESAEEDDRIPFFSIPKPENLEETPGQYLFNPIDDSKQVEVSSSSLSKRTRELRVGRQSFPPNPNPTPYRRPPPPPPQPPFGPRQPYRSYAPTFPPPPHLRQSYPQAPRRNDNDGFFSNPQPRYPQQQQQLYDESEHQSSHDNVGIKLQGRHSSDDHEESDDTEEEVKYQSSNNETDELETDDIEGRRRALRPIYPPRPPLSNPIQPPYAPMRQNIRPPSSPPLPPLNPTIQSTTNYSNSQTSQSHSHSHDDDHGHDHNHEHDHGEKESSEIKDRHHIQSTDGETNYGSECGFRCVLDKKCVSKTMRCDGQTNCMDGSDEQNCTCVERVGAKKLCDSLHDCPNGEDEEQCNGCAKSEFSCNDPKDYNGENRECVDKSKRCNGVSDCLNSMDEKNCLRLGSTNKDFRGVLSEGILQKNIGGKWYFICKKSESSFMLETLSNKVCQMIVGDMGNKEAVYSITPANSSEFQNLSYAFSGENDAKFEITESCPSAQVVNVTCPDPLCGWPATKYDEYSETSGIGARIKKNRFSEQDEIMGKVVGGYDSSLGEWPFLGAIYRNGTFHCGCSIIDKQWVLTAAHCTHGFEKYVFEVQVGMMRRYSWSYVEQTRMVTQVHPHERYDKSIFMNDIALMKLDSPLYLSKWVTTACLAYDKSADPYSDQDCHVVGWGDLTEEGTSPDNLQEVKLPVKPCRETFTREAVQICAGHEEGGKDACQGDSGGPFICRDFHDRAVVHGIVSFGRGCARKGQLGVYTRVSAYTYWIDSILSEENAAYTLGNYYPKHCPGQRCHRSGGECIFPKMICDRKIDCINGEDEANCEYEDTSFANESYELDQRAVDAVKEAEHGHEEHSHESEGGSKLCHDTSEFQCKITKSCVPISRRCNGRFDCSDQSDEEGCKCGAIIANAYPENKCNSFSDCLDGGDEEDCAIEDCGGDQSQMKCPLDNSKCIPKSRWCDGFRHCPYGEDEVHCYKIIKDKNEDPKDEFGFLHDKKSRGLTSGYVFTRQGGTEWKPACAEELGTDVNDLVCPYLALETPGMSNSKNNKRNAPKYVERQLPVARSESGLQGRASSSSSSKVCEQVKVNCGESGCGERRLYAFSDEKSSHPSPDNIGAHPWLALVLVNGIPKCKATLMTKQWAVSPTRCIEDNINALKDDYVTIKAGPYIPSLSSSNPMEQVKRVNYIDEDKTNTNHNNNALTFLHMDKTIIPDHFVSPICSNFDFFASYNDSLYSSMNNLQFGECIRATLTEGDQKAKYETIQVKSCFEGEHFCTTQDQRNCLNSGNSFVYCTTDPESITSWYFIGYLEPQDLKTCNQNTNEIVIINPFYGSAAEKYQDLISSAVPPSVTSPPLCQGTRCPYGNCVQKTKTCDSIQHCSDGSDESRCQRHYQMFRSSDTDEEENTYRNSSTSSCPEGHFRCESTYNCVPINSFCDSRYDCGPDDLTDEPEGQCTCRNYFSLIAPENICDPEGKIHCPDRSDEQQCPCLYNSFHCDEYNSSTSCIHPSLRCDNVKDCRNGKDEDHCVALSTDLNQFQENRTATFISGYVLHRVRNEWHPYCSNDWSKELATAICRKELGYPTLESLRLYDLNEINSIQKGDSSIEQEDEEEGYPHLMFWQKDEDLFGQYSQQHALIEAQEESYEDCNVAFIACSSPS